MQAVEWLRRKKRLGRCFDRQVGLLDQVRQTGWTAEGSPLFDCTRPWRLNVRPSQSEKQALMATLFVRRDYRGPFAATMHVRSGIENISYRLCRPPGWKRYPIPLHGLLGSRTGRGGAAGALELSFTGPQVAELQIAELKLEHDPGWRLRTNVQGVSFPRCGHHMLVEVLESYFGTSFRYCGYYGMCQQRPCPGEITHLQKNHDHELEMPTDADLDYLVQYRHVLGAIVSQYEHLLKQGKAQDSQACWETFALEKLPQWESFVHKWVLDNSNPRAIKLDYQEVLDDPWSKFAAIIQFFAPSHSLNGDRLRQVLREQRVASRRCLTEFRHFHRKFFTAIEAKAAATLSALGLSRQFAG